MWRKSFASKCHIVTYILGLQSRITAYILRYFISRKVKVIVTKKRLSRNTFNGRTRLATCTRTVPNFLPTCTCTCTHHLLSSKEMLLMHMYMYTCCIIVFITTQLCLIYRLVVSFIQTLFLSLSLSHTHTHTHTHTHPQLVFW